MNELIGIPQAAQVLGLTRQMTHLLYTSGKLTAAAFTGTSERPRPLFRKSEVESLARERADTKLATASA